MAERSSVLPSPATAETTFSAGRSIESPGKLWICFRVVSPLSPAMTSEFALNIDPDYANSICSILLEVADEVRAAAREAADAPRRRALSRSSPRPR